MNLIDKNNKGKKLATFLMGAAILSSTITMGFSTALAKDVNLVVKGEVKEVVTHQATVGDFLKAEGIVLKANETVKPSLTTPISDEMDIVISSPKSYKISDGAKTYITKSVGNTVAEVLSNLNIKVGENDVVYPALDQKVDEKDPITIARVEKKSFTQEAPINFEVITNKNDKMYEGEKKVIQKGVKGVETQTVQNTFVNGNLTSIDVIAKTVTKAPVNEIVEVGTMKKPQQAKKESSAGTIKGKKVKKVIVMKATAYDPTAGTKTAMGTRARVGAVAVDPKVIPLGTKLYIESIDGFPSYGYAVAEDTGGAIKGNRIDLFYNTNAQANKFGRRNVKVYVLE